MKKYSIIAMALLIWACKGPEPRKPIQVKSGSFFKESVARSKKLLEIEEKRIHKLIGQDSLNTYYTSPFGFWYRYEQQRDSSLPTPQPDDEVVLTYNLRTLSNDTLYTFQDIGRVQAAIGKSKLFPGLRNALPLLREGEEATFLFPSPQGYGYRGDTDRIGPNTPLRATVKLTRIIPKKDSIN
ncbi:gliding motility-associated peptidyl-prolyl isomerase GldI [Flagellimonas sp. DF-77]|uniref:gliding motility-associated peptidyl-prolyl isomerase GldI n=1 Tax=Flagellimonas algarum TaxID=3230298 RepID=UPI0033964049